MSDTLKRIWHVDQLIRRFPPLYRAAQRRIAHYESLDLDQRRDYRDRALAPILRAAGFEPGQTIADAPLMDKSDLRARPGRFEGPGRLWAAHARTSGTNGEPVAVRRSLGAVVFEQAAIDFVVRQAGFDLSRDRVATLRATRVQGLGKDDAIGVLRGGGRILSLPSNDLSPQTYAGFIAALERFRPQILHVMPGAVDYLADLMIEHGHSLPIPLVLASSEMLTPAIRAKLRQVFGARCVDYYGQAERVSAAYALSPGQYRFIGAYGATELVRSDGAFEIVGTSLTNRAQLLVRYRTGDLVRCALPPERIEAITLGTTSFGGIEGRRDDALVGRDGRRMVAMNYVARQLQDFGRLQFIQERPNQASILLAGWSPAARAHPDAVIAQARQMVPDDFDLDVRFVDTLERSAAGKTPFIIRRF